MYNGSYAQGAKFSLEARKKLQRTRGKSCGYYLRVIFFFSSLIQSLIIVSLVLFLVYGKPQDSASETRIQDLEMSFNRLSMSNAALREQRENLTRVLNVTLMERRRMDRSLLTLQYLANNSFNAIQFTNTKLGQCEMEKLMCRTAGNACSPVSLSFPGVPGEKDAQLHVQFLKQQLQLVQSNFTRMSESLKRELDGTLQERNTFHLQAIALTRDHNTLQKQLELYRTTCKDNFVQSLGGISNVSKAFLKKIDSLFPSISAFQLTCAKQRDQLYQIQNNCTSLSREVENKFQLYLDQVGTRVTTIHEESSRLQAENARLSDDYHWCRQNRSGVIQEHAAALRRSQERQDREKEKMLLEQSKLRGQRELEQSLVKVKSSEISILQERIKSLNASLARCGLKFPGLGQTGIGLGNAGLGRAGSSGTGLGNGGSSYGQTGMGLGRAGSSGTGLGNGGLGQTGIGLGNTGLGRAGSSGTGLGNGGSSYGGLGQTGMGLGRAGSSGTGLGNAGLGRAGSSGTVPGGSWSPSASGRFDPSMGGARMGGSNGFSQMSINQLLRDLQRAGNPPPNQPEDRLFG